VGNAELNCELDKHMQRIMEPVAVDSMVRIMKRSSQPGLWRMKNRVYSRNKQQIQEKTCKGSQLQLGINVPKGEGKLGKASRHTMKEIMRAKRVGRWFKVSAGRYAPGSR